MSYTVNSTNIVNNLTITTTQELKQNDTATDTPSLYPAKDTSRVSEKSPDPFFHEAQKTQSQNKIHPAQTAKDNSSSVLDDNLPQAQ